MNTPCADQAPYAPPRPDAPIDLHLDANEAPFPPIDPRTIVVREPAESLRRYPNASVLEHDIAQRLNVHPERVLVTAGADEAIDRACRAFLAPGRMLILPQPTFEMIERYARAAGATIEPAEWIAGPFPTDPIIDAVNDRTAMIAVVSPNNPTGAVCTSVDLRRLSAAAPNAMLLVDLAYAEYAEDDLTSAALALPNAIVLRTFSKALGLAGARVGFAIGDPRAIRAMRARGSPFPVSAFSLDLAREALRTCDAWLDERITRNASERARLFEVLQQLGAAPIPSAANFILARCRDSEWVWSALASLGIAVRRFIDRPGLEDSLRITCPGDEHQFLRLTSALRSILQPQALIFDLDGVLADVSRSYRRAIADTAASFGVKASAAEIAAAKRKPGSNNDWALTQRLLARAGVHAPLAEVTARFEALYHGSDASPGLHERETLIPSRALLESLAARLPLAIVTGRPRRDAERFLERFDLNGLFRAVVCMEDAPLKPDPAPVQLALRRLGVRDAWMIGDTPDDIASARAASVVPIGIAAPGDSIEPSRVALKSAGAARVLPSLDVLVEMLP